MIALRVKIELIECMRQTPITLFAIRFISAEKKKRFFQVSLWGGDASFQNLDLRLEVLEEQLNLPFVFVSGHIHELLIHVPWVKITSEPIVVTINTIGNTICNAYQFFKSFSLKISTLKYNCLFLFCRVHFEIER